MAAAARSAKRPQKSKSQISTLRIFSALPSQEPIKPNSNPKEFVQFPRILRKISDPIPEYPKPPYHRLPLTELLHNQTRISFNSTRSLAHSFTHCQLSPGNSLDHARRGEPRAAMADDVDRRLALRLGVRRRKSGKQGLQGDDAGCAGEW